MTISLTEAEKLLRGYFQEEITVELFQGYLSVNDLVPFSISVTQSYNRSSSIVIVDDLGNRLGELLFLKDAKKVMIDTLPLEKFICFLDSYPSPIVSNAEFEFTNDYLLLNKDKVNTYLTSYKKTSAIWGGFFHSDDLPNTSFDKTRKVLEISTRADLLVDRSFYLETLEMAFKELNPFLRFLKFYHLIELKFDIHTAEKIKSYLDQGNKEREIGRILRDYNREDIERLKSLFKMNLDSVKIVSYLDNIKNFTSQAETLFYEYGKESNPLKNKKDFDKFIQTGSFSETNVDNILGNRQFNDFIANLTAYWIYRIRSSIAHSKLGEYLMTSVDEEFIIEFAEPLLREVIIHCYKK